MRLSEQERRIIREAGIRHFGVVPRLFGSRLDDSALGGDIDLFVPGQWSPRDAVARRLRFCAELATRLGERKIDVVLEGLVPGPIQEHAKATGEPV